MKKLISILIVILLLAGCSEKTQHVEEPVQDQCTKSVELRVAALSEVWSTAQYYYGYWNRCRRILTGMRNIRNSYRG